MIKNNVISLLEERVTKLVEFRPLPSLEKRYNTIEELNEKYFLRTGHILPSHILNILADWILAEELNNKDVDKVANSEFAILSPRQLKRRDRRENSVECGTMDYLNLKYKKNVSSLAKKARKENIDL